MGLGTHRPGSGRRAMCGQPRVLLGPARWQVGSGEVGQLVGMGLTRGAPPWVDRTAFAFCWFGGPKVGPKCGPIFLGVWTEMWTEYFRGGTEPWTEIFRGWTEPWTEICRGHI